MAANAEMQEIALDNLFKRAQVDSDSEEEKPKKPYDDDDDW